MSRSTFQHYQNIIISYQHRINSIYITNPFMFDLPYSRFPRLETLILENIPSENLENILQQLTYLSHLSSLSIIHIDNVQNRTNLYHQIFRLPALKYCKISLTEHLRFTPLPISGNQSSSITHLIIDNDCSMDHLNNFLSYLPKLRRLTCNHLSGSTDQQINIQPVVLKNLTHVSLKTENIDLDQIELFISKLCPQIQVFHFSTNYHIMYLNAHRWEQLISSHMPNLRIFNIELLPNYESNQTATHTSINHFKSPFWVERQWFFKYEYENSLAAFYSIQLYK
jgi:hypothetical protein